MQSVFHRLVQEIEEFYKNESFQNPDDVSPDILKKTLAQYDFQSGRSRTELFEEVTSMLRKWTIDVTSPNYFGLFNPSVTIDSVIADTLVALYNPQLAVWEHAPMANEIEQHVLSFIGKYIYEGDENLFACFTTGGSEANMTAVLAALMCKIENFSTNGLSRTTSLPVIYISEYAHHSFEKISKSVGLGACAIQRIPATNKFQLDMHELEKQFKKDQNMERRPFLVVGTAGATSYGTIDPLKELSQFCREKELWFHVDAAWGGTALMSDALKPFFAGIEQADSVTIDAHKWLSVGMGAGMFFTKHVGPVKEVFRVSADYMPGSGEEEPLHPYVTTIQWSRRFIGLKLFMTLAHSGERGVARRINHQVAMGNYMKQRLLQNGWDIVNNTPLPVACFIHKNMYDVGRDTSSVLEEVHKEGKYWISDVQLSGTSRVFRACITSFKTQQHHIDNMVTDLTEKVC